MKRKWFVVTVAVLMLVPVSIGPASAHQSGPIEMEGVLHDAAYKIRVPENWNGTLLLYAHGYPTQPVPDPDVAFLGETELLDAGYALAASGFRGAGFNVKEAIWDTKKLLNFFRSEIGRPQHVILYGISMGGTVALKSIEKHPNLYSAAVPLCAEGGGETMALDYTLDYALAYDVVFGWPETWGTVHDVRDDIEFYGEVWFPKVSGEIFGPDGFNWDNYPKWEFVRRVTGTSRGGHYDYSGPIDMPPGVVAMSYFVTQQQAELEVRAGGKTRQNVDRIYSLSAEDKAFLESYGLPVEEWLAEMNARTIYKADPNARRYLERYGDPSGKIKVPVLMVHNVEDSLNDVSHTTGYLETVQARGNEDLLVRAYSSLPGHCNFTVPQMLHVFGATVDWLENGVPPAATDFGTDLDFVPGYSPEP